MRFNYEVRPEDLLALAERNSAYSISPWYSAQCLGGAFLRALVVFLIAHILSKGAFDLGAAGAALIVGSIWAHSYPGRVKHAVLGRLKAQLSRPGNAGLLGPRTLEVTPEEFVISSETLETRLKRQGIQRIVEEDGRFFIYISETHAHVISIDSLSDPAEAAALGKALLMNSGEGVRCDEKKARPTAV
jgi:hypothetical protein